MDQHRYEKEIEEILEKAGESSTEQPDRESVRVPLRRRSPSPRRSGTGRRFALKYQYALWAGIALIVIAAMAHWVYFFVAGLLLLAAGYVMYYRAPRGGAVATERTQQVWRGRSIDPDDPSAR